MTARQTFHHHNTTECPRRIRVNVRRLEHYDQLKRITADQYGLFTIQGVVGV